MAMDSTERTPEYLLVFQPSGKRGRIQEGKTVFEAARELGVDLYSICGGRQTCGKCKVRIEEASFASLGISSGQEHLSPPTEKELEHLEEAAEVARRVEYVELTLEPSFTEEFVRALTFPAPTTDSNLLKEVC
jgi:uncharacterized 2Fe-2S/4Fe-4S cluster protein (DUF4445 family)